MTAIFTLGYLFILVDALAMVGSLIIGVLFIFGLHQEEDNNNHSQYKLYTTQLYTHSNDNNQFARYFSIFLIVFYLLCGTLAFFFLRTPQIIWSYYNHHLSIQITSKSSPNISHNKLFTD